MANMLDAMDCLLKLDHLPIDTVNYANQNHPDFNVMNDLSMTNTQKVSYMMEQV